MSTEENKALVRRAYEAVFNRHNPEAIADFVAEEHVERSPPPGQGLGIEGTKHYLATVFTAFPDLRSTVEAIVAEGGPGRVPGAHNRHARGESRGLPPTGRRVEVTAMHWARIDGGKVVEHWAESDTLGLLQSGMIAAPGQARA
jgi:predicted ester cyclase